jgi:hypothetical protein
MAGLPKRCEAGVGGGVDFVWILFLI